MPYRVAKPKGWCLYVSLSKLPVTRLVVFVHGFRGKAVGTWREFPDAGNRHWWEGADLLFVGYDSTKENITAVANRLRAQLERFFPAPLDAAMSVKGVSPRPEHGAYSELVIVGHSLGGLIVRRALCDAALDWQERGSQPESKPAILHARTRLFSPATAGFRAAGVLGMIRASGLWPAVELFLRPSSAYSDLQPGSLTLATTQSRTEPLAGLTGLDSLRAHIVWANPDNVVIAERYNTDFVDDSWDETTHSTVCKPRRGTFEAPWSFVETGATR